MWGPAQRRPVRSKAHQAAKAPLGKGRATQGGHSHSPQGEAWVGPGVHMMGALPSSGLRGARQAAQGFARRNEQRRVRRPSAALAQPICCAAAAVATKASATAPALLLSGAREAEVGSTAVRAAAFSTVR